MSLFGHSGRLDFTAISQPWLREGAERWPIHDLIRPRGEGVTTVLRAHVAALAGLSASLRTHRSDRAAWPSASSTALTSSRSLSCRKAHTESLFKTLKYGPEFPERFASVHDAGAFISGWLELIEAWPSCGSHRRADGRPEQVRRHEFALTCRGIHGSLGDVCLPSALISCLSANTPPCGPEAT